MRCAETNQMILERVQMADPAFNDRLVRMVTETDDLLFNKINPRDPLV